MSKCAGCEKPTDRWITFKIDKEIVRFHFSPSMEKTIIEDPDFGRMYQVYVCYDCGVRLAQERIGLKDIRFSILLKQAANRAFVA